MLRSRSAAAVLSERPAAISCSSAPITPASPVSHLSRSSTALLGSPTFGHGLPLLWPSVSSGSLLPLEGSPTAIASRLSQPSSPSDGGQGDGRPRSLLQGTSAVAASLNCHLAKLGPEVASAALQLCAAASPKRYTSRRSCFAPELGKPEELSKELDVVSANLAQLRLQHDTFTPHGPTTLNQSLSTGSRFGDADKRPGTTPGTQEFRERMDMLKYVRKIEPELPPLLPLSSVQEPPKDQSIVLLNASREALQSCSPKARKERVANRAAERAACQRAVAERRDDAQTSALQRKKQEAILRAGGGVVGKQHRELNVQLEAGQEAISRWLTAMAAACFLLRACEERRLGRMKLQDLVSLVMGHWDHLKRCTRETAQAKWALELGRRLTSPAFQTRRVLLASFVSARMSVKRRRGYAVQVAKGLRDWQVAGKILLRLQNIAASIRLLQRWWRDCSERLLRIREQLSERWVLLEQVELSRRPAVPGGSMRASCFQRLMPEPLRLRFLEHEMRARRFWMLPQIDFYEEEWLQWRAGIRRTLKAQRLLQDGLLTYDQAGEFLFFSWPPKRPSQIPNDAELTEMIRRARAHPKGEGWSLTCVRSWDKRVSGWQSGRRKSGGEAAEWQPLSPLSEAEGETEELGSIP